MSTASDFSKHINESYALKGESTTFRGVFGVLSKLFK